MTNRIVMLDTHGRLELPHSSRRQLAIGPGDLVEFLVAEDRLILIKLTGDPDPGSRPPSAGKRR